MASRSWLAVCCQSGGVRPAAGAATPRPTGSGSTRRHPQLRGDLPRRLADRPVPAQPPRRGGVVQPSGTRSSSSTRSGPPGRQSITVLSGRPNVYISFLMVSRSTKCSSATMLYHRMNSTLGIGNRPTNYAAGRIPSNRRSSHSRPAGPSRTTAPARCPWPTDSGTPTDTSAGRRPRWSPRIPASGSRQRASAGPCGCARSAPPATARTTVALRAPSGG